MLLIKLALLSLVLTVVCLGIAFGVYKITLKIVDKDKKIKLKEK